MSKHTYFIEHCSLGEIVSCCSEPEALEFFKLVNYPEHYFITHKASEIRYTGSTWLRMTRRHNSNIREYVNRRIYKNEPIKESFEALTNNQIYPEMLDTILIDAAQEKAGFTTKHKITELERYFGEHVANLWLSFFETGEDIIWWLDGGQYRV